MVVQAQEGRLTTASVRVLVATAVPVERDAVARAFASPPREVPLPGTTLHRVEHPAPPAEAAVAPLVDAPAATPASAPATAVPVADAGSRYDLLAAGVGPAAAAAATGAALTAAALAGQPYDLVVSAGIGGGFPPDAPVGSVVVADEITVADLGAETADGFVSVTGLGFGTVTHYPPRSLVRDVAAATGGVTGTVLTVSTVTGSAARAAELRARHPGAVAEAMEGFGVAEAAAAHGCPVLEIRTVSNPVGPRDRAAWRIPEALATLTEAFGKTVHVVESWKKHD
ncbi:futalosine hydrolase [Streptomyces sp. PSKA28]|uniref:Futalosine hydrolase n=1 Tax=Streptomyces himalayensis subsp. himalayensis TaxID=2756131 RepID=A0A7W0DLD5_9ACTN|nr:futalosine hydrolase [Streptomyces himalayensis subsp. himalayensis]